MSKSWLGNTLILIPYIVLVSLCLSVYLFKQDGMTIVTCSSMAHKPLAMKVKGFRLEESGFSGIDTEGKRQYYFKDVNETCYTMSEMEFDKANKSR